MGIKFMALAIDAEVANSGQKLVLVMLANHCNDHTKQCNPSHKLLAKECSMGLSTLKGHINALVDAGFVSIQHVFADNVQKPNSYILNFAPRSESGPPPVRIELPPGQNLATEPEVKPEDNHIGNQKSFLFDSFWKAYPRKTNKGFAKKVFAKLKVTDDLLATMLKAIEVQKRSVWKDKDPQYIPHPSTWLNGERWEDEVQTTADSKSAYGSLLNGI